MGLREKEERNTDDQSPNSGVGGNSGVKMSRKMGKCQRRGEGASGLTPLQDGESVRQGSNRWSDVHQWRTGPQVWHTVVQEVGESWAAMQCRQRRAISSTLLLLSQLTKFATRYLKIWHLGILRHFKLKKLDGRQVQNGLLTFSFLPGSRH